MRGKRLPRGHPATNQRRPVQGPVAKTKKRRFERGGKETKLKKREVATAVRDQDGRSEEETRLGVFGRSRRKGSPRGNEKGKATPLGGGK